MRADQKTDTRIALLEEKSLKGRGSGWRSMPAICRLRGTSTLRLTPPQSYQSLASKIPCDDQHVVGRVGRT